MRHQHDLTDQSAEWVLHCWLLRILHNLTLEKNENLMEMKSILKNIIFMLLMWKIHLLNEKQKSRFLKVILQMRFAFALRGDPRRKSLCATSLKFNYVIKGCLKLILMQKNYGVGFINKEWWPPEETPLWRPKSAYNRHFEIVYSVEKTLSNTTWNRFWFENLYWYYTWDIVR